MAKFKSAHIGALPFSFFLPFFYCSLSCSTTTLSESVVEELLRRYLVSVMGSSPAQGSLSLHKGPPVNLLIQRMHNCYILAIDANGAFSDPENFSV